MRHNARLGTPVALTFCRPNEPFANATPVARSTPMNRFFKNLFRSKTKRQSGTSKARRAQPTLEALEDRQLLTVDLLGVAGSLELADLQFTAASKSSLQETLPVLHSNPGASKTLYLNFLGNTITEDFNARTFNVNRNFNG